MTIELPIHSLRHAYWTEVLAVMWCSLDKPTSSKTTVFQTHTLPPLPQPEGG